MLKNLDRPGFINQNLSNVVIVLSELLCIQIAEHYYDTNYTYTNSY